MSIVDGKLSRFFEFISYDYERKHVRADLFDDLVTENKTLFATVWVYGERDGSTKLYYMDHQRHTCTATHEAKPFERICVHDNHRHKIHFTLGGRLEATMYRYDVHETRNDMVVSREMCVPIQGHFASHHKDDNAIERVEYFNVRLGIGNPVVWILPEICIKAGAYPIKI